MKKILLFLLLLQSISYSQTEWAPIGAKWYFTEPGSNSHFPVYYRTFEVTKDSILLGKNVRVIEIRKHDNSLIGKEYLHQSGDSIFYFNYHSNTYHILYNFSAKVGDTVIVHNTSFEPTAGFISGNSCFKYRILAIDTTLINGEQVKTQSVANASPSCVFGFTEVLGAKIYEKIGYMMYFFGSYDAIDLGGGIYNLFRCYSEPSGFLYPQIQDECDIISNINSFIQPSIKIIPNPSDGIVQINFSPFDQFLELTSLQGQSILQQNLSNNSPENKIILDLSASPSGVYFLSITTKSGEKKLAKIVKQ